MDTWVIMLFYGFCLACFIVETIVYLILKYVPKISYQVFIVTVLTIVGFCSCKELPWCLNIALSCLQFFYVGRLLRKLDFNRFDREWILLVFIILASAFLIGIRITDNKVNIVSSVYGSITEFGIFAYLGIFVFVFLFQIKLTDKQVFKSSMLRYMGGINYIGKNSIVIFALHMPVLRIVKAVFDKLCPYMNYDTYYFVDALLSLLVIVILLPDIPLYNKIKHKLPRIK